MLSSDKTWRTEINEDTGGRTNHNVHKACAIAEMDSVFYSWHIQRFAEPSDDESLKPVYKWRIVRLGLNQEPPEPEEQED